MHCNDCSTYMSPHEGSPDKSGTSSQLLNEVDHRVLVYIKSRMKSHKIIIKKEGEDIVQFSIFIIVYILNHFLKLAVACLCFPN